MIGKRINTSVTMSVTKDSTPIYRSLWETVTSWSPADLYFVPMPAHSPMLTLASLTGVSGLVV